eukprot:9130304-Alexandrium_andersonii.AAC.1
MARRATPIEPAEPGVRNEGVVATVGLPGAAADVAILLEKPEASEQYPGVLGLEPGRGATAGGQNASA